MRREGDIVLLSTSLSPSLLLLSNDNNRYRSAVETSVKIGLVVLWVTVSSTKSFFHILGVIWYPLPSHSPLFTLLPSLPFPLLDIRRYSNKNGRVYAHLFPFVFYNEGTMNTWLVIFPVLWVKKGPSKTTISSILILFSTHHALLFASCFFFSISSLIYNMYTLWE